MLYHSEIVTGYVDKPIKARLRQIRKIDRRITESEIIEKALERYLPDVEKALGISKPTKVPAENKKLSALLG